MDCRFGLGFNYHHRSGEGGINAQRPSMIFLLGIAEFSLDDAKIVKITKTGRDAINLQLITHKFDVIDCF